MDSARALIARGWGVSLVSRCLRVSRAQLHVILRRTDDWKDGRRSRHSDDTDVLLRMNRPGFPGECFICELRLPDHRFRWKHNKLFLLLPVGYGPAFPAIVDCYTSPPT